MRILVLSYEFPPVGGGGGRAAQDIGKFLVRRGHQVLVLTSYLDGLPRYEMVDGLEVVRVRCGRKMAYKATLLDMAGYILAAIWAGLRLVPAWKPDIIHVHFAVPTGPAGWFLAKIFHIPYILTVHLGDVPGGVPEKTRGWFRWIYPFTPMIWNGSRQVVAVSEYTRQLAQQHYPVDILVIPNGADVESLASQPMFTPDPVRIVFAGRFMTQKNLLQLVKTLAGIKQLNWTCVLLGDGPLRKVIEAEITRSHLNDRIQLKGWVSPPEVEAVFMQSSILFMPSLSEGFPITGVQGLAAGLAIVASRVGGFVDLVREGENGYLFDPRDVDGMQNILKFLIENPAKLIFMRQASKRLAVQFDLVKIAADYEHVFLKVVDQSTHRL